MKLSLFNHELEVDYGPSAPDPGRRRQYDKEGVSYIHTNDIVSWLRIDNSWHGISNATSATILEYAALAESEEELLEYLKVYEED